MENSSQQIPTIAGNYSKNVLIILFVKRDKCDKCKDEHCDTKAERTGKRERE